MIICIKSAINALLDKLHISKTKYNIKKIGCNFFLNTENIISVQNKIRKKANLFGHEKIHDNLCIPSTHVL